MEEFLLVFHVLSNGTPEENLQVCEYACVCVCVSLKRTKQEENLQFCVFACVCVCVYVCVCLFCNTRKDLQKIFRIFDVNNDGTISETEMEKLVEDMKVLLGVG